MGFCILGGKENYLRKIISDKLTSLGQTTNIGATPATYSTNIQNIYDGRYTEGQDSLKTNRKLTLTSSQTGSNVDITDNWYTTVDASAVYSAGQTAGGTAARVGNATDADVRSGKTYTNSSTSGRTGSMPDLTSSNFAGSFSSSTAGAASNYNVKSSSAGYVANNTTVLSKAAGTSATIDTTSGSGTQTINCVPGIYNKISVNQNPAYNAGEVQGRAANKGMTVYSLQTNENGSGQLRSTVTQTLPAGTYHCAVHLYTHGNGVAYMPTVTLTFGNTTRTYHDSIPSTGTGYHETGNIISIIDTFTLSSNTSVTLSIAKAGTGNNYGMSNGIASIY